MRVSCILRKVLLVALLFNLFTAGNQVYGQSTKLYLDEINRLKEDKSSLSVESETYKYALKVEQQKTAQLEQNLTNIQATVQARDEQIARLNQAVAASNSTITRWHRISGALSGILMLLMMSVAVYWHREILARQLRKILEFRLIRTGKQEYSEENVLPFRRQPVVVEETEIRPEEIFERLYGRRKAS